MDKETLRQKILELHYELSDGSSWKHVLRPDVGKKLGVDHNNDKLLGAIKYLEDKGFLKVATNVEETITVYGIDEVENGFPTLGTSEHSQKKSDHLIKILHEIDDALKLGKEGILQLKECSELEQKVMNTIEASLIEGSENWRRFDKEKKRTRWKSVTNNGYLDPKDLGGLEFWRSFIEKLLNEEGKSIKKEHIIKAGEPYTARKILREVLRKASQTIAIQDNYVDETLFLLLEPFKQDNKGLQVRILTTDKFTPSFKSDLTSFNMQYGNSEARIHKVKNCHDRFIIVDNKELYHSGHSFKNLGEKLSAINLMEDEGEKQKFFKEFETWWKKGIKI